MLCDGKHDFIHYASACTEVWAITQPHLTKEMASGSKSGDRSGKSLQIRCVEVGQGEAIWDKGVLKRDSFSLVSKRCVEVGMYGSEKST